MGTNYTAVQQRSNQHRQETCSLLVERRPTVEQAKRPRSDHPLLQGNTGHVPYHGMFCKMVSFGENGVLYTQM